MNSTDTAPATYCETLLAVLNVLARAAPGTLCLDFGTPERGAVKLAADARPLFALPTPVLSALESEWHTRVTPALLTDDSREPVSVATLFARFRPVSSFSRERGHHVGDEEPAKIRAALAGFLPPAFIVDALGEVTAWWPLREPLRDMARARALQRRLAERLGAVTAIDIEMAPPSRMIGPGFAQPVSHKLSADDPASWVSIAGKCQNVGTFGRWVSIDVLDAERTDAVDEIEAALTPPTNATTEPAAETTSRRKGARV